MRKLATVRTIGGIRPIPEADRIEVAEVDGWECVVKKSEGFKPGDKIVYVEIDSIMPDRPEFEFLKDRNMRVKTIKLRGQISQGLVLPLSVLPKGGEYKVGDDVTDILGVKKYDPQAEQEEKAAGGGKRGIKKYLMRFAWFRRFFGKKERDEFPNWISKTDEERIQNKVVMFEHERDQRTPFIVTEKIDGTSGTFYIKRIRKNKFEFGVCSRNRRLTPHDNSSYWAVCDKFDIKRCLKGLLDAYDANSVILQGEIIGTGIQGNKYEVTGYDFYAFNLIADGVKINTVDMTAMLGWYNIKSVPIVEEEFTLPDTIAELVEYSKGRSKLLPSREREGLVIRSYEKNISFKVINPDFLIKYE